MTCMTPGRQLLQFNKFLLASLARGVSERTPHHRTG